MNMQSIRTRRSGPLRSARGLAIALALVLPVATDAAPLDDKIALATRALDATRGSADPARYAAADKALAELSASAPDAPHVKVLRAWQQMARHRFQEALVLTDAALNAIPADPLALALQADALTELGRYDEAVEAVQTLLDRSPAVVGFPRAAQLRFIRGDLEGAAELTARALSRAEPGSRNARWLTRELARFEVLTGNVQGALSRLDAASVLEPEDHAARAHVLLIAGQTEAARMAWQRAFDAVPQAEYALPLWKLARARDDRREAGRLGRYLDALARLDPEGLSNRTLIEYFGLGGRPAEALRLARAELRRRPDIYGHAQLAWTLNLAGLHADAREHGALALSTGCRDPELLRWLDDPATGSAR
ncbi:MAG TPA: hypothetical protein PKE01_09220 [Rhodocyclaceae bacterium]|uniref:hypothetical protein n=1 Tax=Zoogloea sp. TaxID=49181 RepID=UPI002D1AE6CF|nr:hypothetical protein [Zoogloea sp.]HMV63506.1 hypothetical protein [Rhodocyclaceae bacterium]HMW52123.1 hypothetical protein [Rhodocyclaceae bacterium]HMY48437.1 hypothetical protein [Rhodocyclaceae bacterium]HMZ75921.1 hypothetical protein [Rhodocyclaceae bacterium]HNA67969.1 hypothetical protein [Rhodocyclaceae bacterium]